MYVSIMNHFNIANWYIILMIEHEKIVDVI